MDLSLIVIVVVVTALVFDFTNGFHDTANAMATSIATRALSPRTAVLIAAVLNVVGAFLSVEVARTISSGLVDETRISPVVIFAGLIGAIIWNLVTWLLGLPSSSSHALFGGLIGATLVAAGLGAVDFGAVFSKVILPAVVSPVLAGITALIATYLAYRTTARADAGTVRRGFRVGQIGTASMVALAHGTSDAQKTMGVITLTLITAGVLAPDSGPPFWVILAAGLAIGLGTYFGGWRIIRTLGKRVSEIETPQGFAAEASTTAVILTSSHLGFALSTTQVATGSIVGAGAGRRLAAVRWSVAGQMAIAWVLTLPAAAVVGAVAAWVSSTGTVGTVLVAVVAIALAAGIYAASRLRPVTADNVNDVDDDAAVRHEPAVAAR
ncbi:inorganic phosphate transporter [Actinomycetospora lutea]|uniref:inorganic phosphate transporter n=1 Tax=Actinomycetospora lutea TaxID=663604 RepID=UPI002365C5B8|nr:inorganic phosphate transporter [Actinomycetospora lutea]MDD7938901.1 inorganic phosphate transporter [Actinomycetospora lutea]